MDLLASNNNQIMFGRRGTGKTHALRFFEDNRQNAGDLAIYIDAQTVGSNGSIYNDTSLPISERATRLMVDICTAIHHELLEVFTDPSAGWDLSKATPVLDRFIDGFTDFRVVGDTEAEYSSKQAKSKRDTGGVEPLYLLSQARKSGYPAIQIHAWSARKEQWFPALRKCGLTLDFFPRDSIVGRFRSSQAPLAATRRMDDNSARYPTLPRRLIASFDVQRPQHHDQDRGD